MELPYLYLKPPRTFLGLECKLEAAKYVVLPIPFDSTESYKPGQMNAPRAIIDASLHIDSIFDPKTKKKVPTAIYTSKEIELPRGEVDESMKRIKELVGEVIRLGKIPVIIGGEHTVSFGALAAFEKRVKFVVLDAHADLRDEFEGSKLNYATFCRRIVENGVEVIEIGVRSISEEEYVFANSSKNLKILYKWELDEDFDKCLEKIEKFLKGERIYLSIDFDVLDPSIARGVSHLEPNGFNWIQICEVLTTIHSCAQIVGFDLVEVIPDGFTEEIAAKLLCYLLSLLG
ncbi:MAG: agmatinase [Candidatus Nanoarchaeia archaeon]|nr:agmatinase [Candidatus Haiyanarchaeum thermophilum]MCW1302902.1 agmatinase [Candidatus Haiyanarchaeum thermophilum]MCW1303581.1 agmatinase [Candidatus Haiyanarchaeum thermophilum]MCW1306263.1 agmatinase [Candidatus Haiyanarchaeum thermophilum]MCW1307501.1 agmatinase [Candidatus Haiyanarchaeum thermophilum]